MGLFGKFVDKIFCFTKVSYNQSKDLTIPERGAKCRLLMRGWYIGKGLSFNAAFVLKDHTRHEDSGYNNNLYIKMQTEVTLVKSLHCPCHRKGGWSLSVVVFALEE